MAQPNPLFILQTLFGEQMSQPQNPLWVLPSLRDGEILSFLHGFDVWTPYAETAGAVHAAGGIMLPDWPEQGAGYDAVFIAIPKQMDELKFWIARAAATLKDGGLFALAGANDAGGGRLISLANGAGFDILHKVAKAKSKGVLLRARTADQAMLKTWYTGGDVQQKTMPPLGQSFYTQPGLFGHDQIDTGSYLLTQSIENLHGAGMDLGCGYGYLSQHLLQQKNPLTRLIYVDHDRRAVFCAQKNLEQYANQTTLIPLWLDARRPFPDGVSGLDFVVMNPPFHTGAQNDITLGQIFIKQAAMALRAGGALWMVANEHLPYAHILQERFDHIRIVRREKGFKIFHAQKR